MDIDIDTKPSFSVTRVFSSCTPATLANNGVLTKHPVGAYFQRVKTNPNGTAALPYNVAHAFGLFKVDFLHLSLLEHFHTKDEIRRLSTTEPNWSLLEDEEIVSTLFQLHSHYDVVEFIKPRSVQELADCIALIRPGKRQLVDQYHSDKRATREELYRTPLPKGCFKKAHAIAYAVNVILQLHVIERIRTGFCEF